MSSSSSESNDLDLYVESSNDSLVQSSEEFNFCTNRFLFRDERTQDVALADDFEALVCEPDDYEIHTKKQDENYCVLNDDDDDHDGDGYYWLNVCQDASGDYSILDAPCEDFWLTTVFLPGDCDDEDSTANPGATEDLTNKRDDNCNGLVDEVIFGASWFDNDHDGQAEDLNGDGISDFGADCDDTNPDVYYRVGLYEIPETEDDDNCDGLRQNNDGDGDGYPWSPICDKAGRHFSPTYPLIDSCESLNAVTATVYAGRIVKPGSDCDDGNPNVHPGQTENLTNKIDDNCNGLIDEKL